MIRNASLCLALSTLALAAPSLAHAQGVIITPSYTTPAPQQQVYAPAPTYAAPYGTALQCPADATLQPDRRGIMRCMRLESGHRTGWGFAGSGIGLMAGGWLIEILTTAFSSLDSDFAHRDTYMGWGFVPLVGPWVQMTDVPSGTLSSYYVWLGFEGLLQDVGLVLFIVGLAGEDYEEYRAIAAGDVRVRPVMSASMQGLMIEGAF
jgi:hypothetical protein